MSNPYDNISFSQVSKYLQCPKSYQYYYIQRLRERSATAFLAFGSAIDAALNSILRDLQKKGKVTVDYKKEFDNNWQTIEINKVKHGLKTCTLVGYAKADFVPELLQKQDLEEIQIYIKALAPIYLNLSIPEIQKELETRKSQRAYVKFDENSHQLLNVLNWYSMRSKGRLMLDAYVRDIVPQIEKVVSIQQRVDLTSPCGTKMIGYIDGVVRFKGDTEDTILDNKTSASPYDDDKVSFSPQLATYGYVLDLNKAAFGVMLKNIKLNRVKTCKACGNVGEGRHKTCDAMVSRGGTGAGDPNRKERCNGEWDEVVAPEAQTQLIKGEIIKATQEMVIDNMADVLDGIKGGVFPRNLNACQNMFGNPCSYLNLCWKNKSDNLETV